MGGGGIKGGFVGSATTTAGLTGRQDFTHGPTHDPSLRTYPKNLLVVILSAAKNLFFPERRPFAALRVTILG